jgi:plasmid stabilization system protein ParE
MANSLFWTARALQEYNDLISYLYENWGDAVTQRIVEDINKNLDHIQHRPKQYPVFLKKRGVRRCVASPQTSIFFIIKKDGVEISAVFDNRQNPRKRKL